MSARSVESSRNTSPGCSDIIAEDVGSMREFWPRARPQVKKNDPNSVHRVNEKGYALNILSLFSRK